jgi:hypothetical protein
MVSKRAYSLLVGESYSGSTISFVEDEGEDIPLNLRKYGINKKRGINGETWEFLEKLHRGEGWPRSDLYVQKKFEELKALHQAWPDRINSLNEAYNQRMKELESKGNNDEL